MTAVDWTEVAAVSQAFTVLIAGLALVYGRGQVREARETRERVAQPDVVVYVDRHEVRRYMNLVIKNFGQTAAYNVRLKLPPLQLAPYRDLNTAEEVKHLYVPDSIAVLAPGQEWRTVWDSAVRRAQYKGPPLQDRFVGHVDFDDKMVPDKPSYRNPISLDIRMFWNTTWITENKSKTPEGALYDIADTLKKYGQEHNGVWVYTTPGHEELQYQEQLAGYMRTQHDEMMDQLMGGHAKSDEGPQGGTRHEHQID